MKRLLLILYLLFGSLSIITAQIDESPITKFLIKRGYRFPPSLKNNRPDSVQQWPDTLYYNTVYKSKLLGSITIPFLNSGIEIKGGIPSGNYSVTPTIGIGVGYTWFWGDFIFNENDKITVDPKVFFGLAATTGLSNGLNLEKGGLYVSGFIGISTFNLTFGYDILNHSPTLGLGGRVDLYTISQKYLHVIGKVHEMRKHKRIAPPITRE
jgi:hypothetical protein